MFVGPSLFLSCSRYSNLGFARVGANLCRFISDLIVRALLRFPTKVGKGGIKGGLLLSRLLRHLSRLQLGSCSRASRRRVDRIPRSPRSHVRFRSVYSRSGSGSSRGTLRGNVYAYGFSPYRGLVCGGKGRSSLGSVCRTGSQGKGFPGVSSRGYRRVLRGSPPFFLDCSGHSYLGVLRQFLRLFFRVSLIRSLQFLACYVFKGRVQRLCYVRFNLLEGCVVARERGVIFFFFFFCQLHVSFFSASLEDNS